MARIECDLSVEYNAKVVLDPELLKQQYMHGVNVNWRDKSMDNSTLELYIKQAQTFIERFLSIKLVRQLVKESKDFVATEYQSWSHVQMTYPIVCMQSIDGYIGTVKVAKYPIEWATYHRSNVDDFSRVLRLVPNRNGTVNFNGTIYTNALTSFFSTGYYYGHANLPEYWDFAYVTGFPLGRIPEDILMAVGQMAAIQALAILGETQFRIPGATSESISLDGLSQSINTAFSANGGIYNARIKMYSEQLVNNLKNLRDFYGGIFMQTL